MTHVDWSWPTSSTEQARDETTIPCPPGSHIDVPSGGTTARDETGRRGYLARMRCVRCGRERQVFMPEVTL